MLLALAIGHMATYDQRLTGYTTEGFPDPEHLVEVLCLDHVGTYILPFLCRHDDTGWSSEEGRPLDTQVVGWRTPQAPPSQD